MGEGYGRKYGEYKVRWDGKTVESALRNLKKFAEKELLKNPETVSLRPYPFTLLYTKEKSQYELLGIPDTGNILQ